MPHIQVDGIAIAYNQSGTGNQVVFTTDAGGELTYSGGQSIFPAERLLARAPSELS